MDSREELEASGYVVLRGLVDAASLSAELDAALADAFADHSHANTGSAGNRFRYVPMMNELTPVSLAITRQLAGVAGELLGEPVLPGRTKATRYLTGSDWHRDAEVTLRTIGMLCYLDALDAGSGALRVVPGSHRRWAATSHAPDSPDGGVVVATEPGDVIVFDERLLHASSGGGRWRRQWRVDFIADDRAGDPAAEAELRAYYAGLHAIGWDGGYDVARYPSYGAAWRRLDPRWDRRLTELGAYAAAKAEEDAAARGRATRRP